MKRRNFLKALPIGAVASAIPFKFGRAYAKALLNAPMLSALSNANEQSDRSLVIIFMEGGNDGLNTLVPFEDENYDKLRKNTGFVSSEDKASITFRIRDDLGFNPSFNALQPLWHEGKMAAIQNIGITNADLSHFRATDIWNSASDTDLLIPTGWIARYLEQLYPTYPTDLPEDPIAISMGDLQSSIFQASQGSVDIAVRDPSNFSTSGQLVTDNNPLTAGGTELGFVKDLINVSNFYSKRFESLFPANAINRVPYPDNPLANNLRQIAWCIASGMKTRIYFTYLNGFDTHASQFSKDPTIFGQGQLLKYVADAVFAFQRDLEALKVADKVITMTYSEFGRRVFENGDWVSGTDHGTAAPHFIFGTNVNGGLYGHHPDLVNLDEYANPFNEFEFRQLYAAVLGDWFGVDEMLRTSILSPGRTHDPFNIKFPINGTLISESLIRGDITPVRRSPDVPSEAVSANPNPFTNETSISFQVAQSSNVLLDIFNDRGEHVKTLLNTNLGAGTHEAILSGRELNAGSYYFRLQMGSTVRTGKLVCIK